MKTSYLIYILGGWSFLYCFNLGFIHLNSLSRDNKTKKHNLICAKDALLKVSKQFFFSKYIQNLLYMFCMFLQCLAVNKDIIKVNHNNFSNESS